MYKYMYMYKHWFFFLPKYQCVLNVTISLIKLFILVIHFLTAQYSPTETQQSRTLKCPFLGNVNEIIPLDEHKHWLHV